MYDMYILIIYIFVYFANKIYIISYIKNREIHKKKKKSGNLADSTTLLNR